ncbi:hypothetical protein HY635_00555 [Candidatus Uhrbacteria bacterium]|nr:hypothetical protein [Candidatus Uhrbacteria bacterium]
MAKSDLEKTLQQFGLEGKRAAVYLALLQTGRVPIPQVARAAGVKRTTAYSILKSLEEEMLVSRGVLGKKQIFIPEDPAKIRALLDTKQKSLDRILPELRSFYNLLPSKPKVRFYEGLEGVKSIFEDVLITNPKELVAFTSLDDLVNILGPFIRNYTARKADIGIPTRAISTDTPFARRYNQLHYAKANPPAVPKIRFVPKEKFPFKNEINIYGNKVAIMSLKTEELVGVVMESIVMADTQRAIFELAWEGADKYQ